MAADAAKLFIQHKGSVSIGIFGFRLDLDVGAKRDSNPVYVGSLLTISEVYPGFFYSNEMIKHRI